MKKMCQNLMLTVLLFMLFKNIRAVDDHCIASQLVVENRQDTTKIIKNCFDSECRPYYNLEFGGVVGLLFFGKDRHTTWSSSGNVAAAQDFEEYALDSCSLSTKYRDCLKNTIHKSNLSLASGTLVDMSFFRQDIFLAIQLLPDAAFCDADEGTRKIFYEFLDAGGRQCVTNQANFLDKISPCLFHSYVMDDPKRRVPTGIFLNRIKICTPPLLRECENGIKLEQLFSQSVPGALFKAYDSTWQSVNNSCGKFRISLVTLFVIVFKQSWAQLE